MCGHLVGHAQIRKIQSIREDEIKSRPILFFLFQKPFHLINIILGILYKYFIFNCLSILSRKKLFPSLGRGYLSNRLQTRGVTNISSTSLEVGLSNQC